MRACVFEREREREMEREGNQMFDRACVIETESVYVSITLGKPRVHIETRQFTSPPRCDIVSHII